MSGARVPGSDPKQAEKIAAEMRPELTRAVVERESLDEKQNNKLYCELSNCPGIEIDGVIVRCGKRKEG